MEKPINTKELKPQEEKRPQEAPLDIRRLICLSVVYFIILFWFVLFKCNQNDSLTVEYQSFKTIWEHFLFGSVPFKTFVQFILHPSEETFLIFANFILFIPSGICLSFLMSKKATVGSIFAIALSVELIQLFTGWGGYDITDVIITFLGGVFGMWIFKKLRPLVPNALVNTIAYGIYLGFTPLAAFVILNTVVNFPPIGHTTLF